MNYTIEEIYYLVGKDDKTAGITFKYDSDGYKMFGSFITVVFLYTQKERELMDKLIEIEPFSNSGWIRAKFLGTKFDEEKIDFLEKKGIFSEDIAEILYFNSTAKNTFHSTAKREVNTLNIKTESQPKGGDFDWMYGFSKRLVKDNVGFCPKERAFYLAGKMYYEPENLTEEENSEIYSENRIAQPIEWEFLQIKYIREDISDEEKKTLGKLYAEKKRQCLDVLDNYLKQSGSSLKKLSNENPDQAVDLFSKVLHFKERRLNVAGKFPIYIDLDSYLHIFMRHVEEFKVNEHFEHKDNFQWDEENVFYVMREVILSIQDEYQDFKKNNPEKRYSRYGDYSLYFLGDYYTFHIEPDGRVSTFHKNKKPIQKKPKA
jgi:hypothetical protein